jgi:hypothetical protein
MMPSHLEFSPETAQLKALKFVANEWNLALADQEWLTVLNNRLIGESWYVVEVGVEGLPDKWVVQVYDTGECDPDYTFMSPIATLDASEAELYPPAIAQMLQAERHVLRPSHT